MSGLLPPNVLSYVGQVVVPFMRETFNPTPEFFNFNVPTIWINTETQLAFILVAKPQNVAVWIPFAGGKGDIMTLTGNSGGAVPPTSGNINIVGDNINLTTVGNPGTSTITVEPLGSIPIIFTENTGTATPSAGNLNVLGTNGITTSGSGSTITISGSGAAGQFLVDAFTSPGTNPVVPNSSGEVTITGGQVAAGTTTNVIRTDSLAANTFTIQIQRSQAVASSTVGDNGVSHFNSANFTVDSNGFVSIIGGLGFSSIKNQVFTSSGTYIPTSGMEYCQITCVGGGGAGGGAASTDGSHITFGGGGGSGEVGVGAFSASSVGSSQTITIGSGGTGASGAIGGSGGNTSVGSLITANGGSGGNTLSTSGINGTPGGSGGTGGSGGDYHTPGGVGFIGWGNTTGPMVYGGEGYSGSYGEGGGANFPFSGQSAAGHSASGYGAGGGGATNTQSQSAVAGGNGSGGLVIITEYIAA